jgi:hypothetical protein
MCGGNGLVAVSDYIIMQRAFSNIASSIWFLTPHISMCTQVALLRLRYLVLMTSSQHWSKQKTALPIMVSCWT